MVDLTTAREIYEADGCFLAPSLFDGSEVDMFLDATARVVAGEYRGARRPDAAACRSSPSDRDLRKIDNAWWADPDLASLATDPRLAEIAAALLGASEVRLWQDQLLYKPPGGPDDDDDRLAPGLGELGHGRVPRRVRHRVGRVRRRRRRERRDADAPGQPPLGPRAGWEQLLRHRP